MLSPDAEGFEDGIRRSHQGCTATTEAAQEEEEGWMRYVVNTLYSLRVISSNRIASTSRHLKRDIHEHTWCSF